MKRFVFGPVPSRRLGRSLGIDIVPAKTCTFDCRYCQLSATTNLTSKRQAFVDPQDVIREIREVLSEIDPPDWITFSGTGEPTLHSGLGTILRAVKGTGSAPVCVITNGSLLWMPQVRDDLSGADRVLPTLCSVREETFRFIHRPSGGLSLGRVLGGLRAFSREYKGFLEVEIFVCPGLNDSSAEMKELGEFLGKLPRLSQVYLNGAVRSPLDPAVKPSMKEDFERCRNLLALEVPVVSCLDSAPPTAVTAGKRPPTKDEIIALLFRHPCTSDYLARAFGTSQAVIAPLITELSNEGRIVSLPLGDWKLEKP